MTLCGWRDQDDTVAANKQHLDSSLLLAIDLLIRFLVDLHYVYNLFYITQHHVQMLVESLKLREDVRVIFQTILSL